MNKDIKNALIELLRFKMGVSNKFIDNGILKPIKEYEFLTHSNKINFISNDDIDAKYVKVGKTGKIYSRKPIEIDNLLLYKDNLMLRVLDAAFYFVQFIEDLNDKSKLPLDDKIIPEKLSADDLIKIIYRMPILHGIYHSEASYTNYLEELKIEDILNYSIDCETIFVEINNERIDECSIDEAIEIINNDDIQRKKFYKQSTMSILGYADSTFDDLKWKCNKIHLCQMTIIRDILNNSDSDPWNNNKFWFSVLYHELAHVIFGHRQNRKVTSRNGVTINKINYIQEHEAQTYSSVLFSDTEATKHIRIFSYKQPVEYQNMPLWGDAVISKISFDKKDFKDFIIHMDTYIKGGKPCSERTANTYVNVISKLLNNGVSYINLIHNIDKYIVYYNKENCRKRGEDDHNSNSALNKLKSYLEYKHYI